MNELKYKFREFMVGRYGIDELYYFIFVVYAVIVVINAFVHSFLITLLLWVLVIYMFYRVLSKNISARQKENAKYLLLKSRFKNGFSKFKKRVGDKDHAYKKCPHCKATLRFPRKKGSHNAVCPKCRNNLKVHIWYEYKK